MKYYWDNWTKELITEDNKEVGFPPERYMRVVSHNSNTFIMRFFVRGKGNTVIDFAYSEYTEKEGRFTQELTMHLERHGLTLDDIFYPADVWFVPKKRLELLKKQFGLK